MWVKTTLFKMTALKTTSIPATLAKSGRLGMVGILLSIFVAGTAQARTLDTAFGDVDVEGTPERVVTLRRRAGRCRCSRREPAGGSDNAGWRQRGKLHRDASWR